MTPERVRVGPLHQRPLHRLREPAVANAHPDVVAAADEVAASNDQDGVVLVLERLAIRKLTAKTGVESRERPLGERSRVTPEQRPSLQIKIWP